MICKKNKEKGGLILPLFMTFLYVCVGVCVHKKQEKGEIQSAIFVTFVQGRMRKRGDLIMSFYDWHDK